jgi:dTDP-4-amino-4,6-dideoxygalactose transaminase
MGIPLLDMQAQIASVKDELDAAIAQVIAHGKFVAGPEVKAFEASWAEFCGARHALGVSSGTQALTLGLKAAGVRPGDEVITTAMTFIATAESIIECGAIPVLADPDPDTALLTPEAVEPLISERTTALVPVHLYGQPVDMDGFRALAQRRGLILAEDAAQAHGATWNGIPAGAAGDFAAFSFFPGKNLGAFGDAGGLTTQDDALAARVAKIRDHGRVDKYRHDEIGTNARLDTLQAAILSVKLAKLAEWNDGRRRVAAVYDEAFAGAAGVEPIVVGERAVSCYHQYVVRVDDRDTVLTALRDRGISAGVHYPIPLHRQPALQAGDCVAGELPNADRLGATVLSLPVFPELSDDDARTVADAVIELTPAGVR